MRYVPELYFKSPAEMSQLFRDFPEAIANTLTIAERCNVDARIRAIEISALSGAGGHDARSDAARVVLQRIAETVWRARGE